MIESQKIAVKEAGKAVKDAKLAYQLTPNSYTYSCLLAALATQGATVAVSDDWGCDQSTPQSGVPVTK